MKVGKDRYFITGGAGFIGSHLAAALLPLGDVAVYDNFTSGRAWHFEDVDGSDAIDLVEGDLKDLDRLARAMAGSRTVFHLASNPDIARAAREPDIDFWEGTYLTSNVLEAMRLSGARRLVYASGSGVYGDTGDLLTPEDYTPMRPISTYGASKLACEALICSYCHMFGLDASALRFANVVGPRQTHGVGYDFVRKLTGDPSRLAVLGDGTQSKSYIYVDDVVSAVTMLAREMPPGFDAYNVATLDHLSVDEIAEIVIRAMSLEGVEREYSGGDRGWKGDVPVVRLDSRKIRALGWTNRLTSREAMERSVASICRDAAAGRFTWSEAAA